jgi:DNA (cytosine-5)-methyltransferase 1
MMRYLSVCSGVEAASVAWHDLGWTPVGFSEIEPFPSAVLAHRFPHVKNYGDMTKYKEWNLAPGTVDVLVGGTPCQSFSVAGLRKGLDDPRGNLMLVYLGLAEHLRVPWLVWENVPGVLSSNGGRDFGTFLGALGELGYRWSFRVLDAQHFGVPQRRRRVFVVAHLGDGEHPAKVLFEPESLRGDSAKGGKTRQGAPRGVAKGAAGGGRPGPFWNGNDVAEALTRTSDDQRMPDKGRMQMVVQPFRMTAFGQYEDDDSGSTCKQRDYSDGSEDGTGRGTPIVPAIAFHPTQLPIGLDEEQNAVVDGFGTLKARMLGGGFEGTVAFAQNTRDEVRLVGGDGQTVGALAAQPGMKQTTYLATIKVTGTLSSRATAGGGLGTNFEVAGGLQPVTVLDTYNQSVSQDVTPPMTVGNAGNTVPNVLAPAMQVRRLLPVETERLQGFPDDHTNIPWRGKPAPDGPRYKAMGNSMAVPVMRWIGERLDRVAKGVR